MTLGGTKLVDNGDRDKGVAKGDFFILQLHYKFI